MAEIRYLNIVEELAFHQAMMEKFGLASAPFREEGMGVKALPPPCVK